MVTLIGFILAVVVFVTTQCVLRLVLEPVSNVRSALTDLSSCLIFHYISISHCINDKDAIKEIRRAASNLRAAISGPIYYSKIAAVKKFKLPTLWDADQASLGLAIIAANMELCACDKNKSDRLSTQNKQLIDEVGKRLAIPVAPSMLDIADYERIFRANNIKF